MFPSNFMLGLPDESLSNPGKYSISARWRTAINILSDDRQTLIDYTLEQRNRE